MEVAAQVSPKTESLESAFEKLEKRAKADGVQMELLVEKSDSTSICFQKGKLESFESSNEHCGGIRVVMNGCEGYSYSENLSTEALEASYKDAVENAKFAMRGADPSRAAQLYNDSSVVKENPDLCRFSSSASSMDQKIEYAKRLESAGLEVDPRIVSVPNSEYSENFGEFLIFNSLGVRRQQRRSSANGYTYCLAKQGDEGRTGAKSFFSRTGRDLPIEEVAREAAAQALRKLGSGVPETGKYPVLLDAEVARGFFSLLLSNFSARNVHEKTSFFSGLIGQKIASQLVQMTDDPLLADGIASRPFDGEGARTQATALIKDGILQGFLTNSDYARRMGLPHTASASRGARSQLDISISNIVIKPGTQTREQLVQAYPRMVLLTSLTGFHAGYQDGSGDFSLQSEGELWENGQFVKPLANFVTSGNIREAMKQIVGLGATYPRRTSSILSPDVLIEELSIAGK